MEEPILYTALARESAGDKTVFQKRSWASGRTKGNGIRGSG